MSSIEAKVEHYGSLHTLYERVSNHSSDPRTEIERFATMALKEGAITRNHYIAVGHRVPFPGYPWKSYRELIPILKVSLEGSRYLERKASMILLRNLPRYITHQSVTEVPVASLPWKATSMEGRVREALINNLEQDRRSVGDAVEYLLQLYRKLLKNPTFRDKGFGIDYYQTACNVFERVGIPLPEV